jgi:hypothetical protein
MNALEVGRSVLGQGRPNQPHPAQVKPSWYGNSVGHYEGNTLVIDVWGRLLCSTCTAHRAAPRCTWWNVIGCSTTMPLKKHRNAARQDLSRLGRDPGLVPDPNYMGKGLQLEFTVEDDSVFTSPWSAAVSYRRPLGEWPEVACTENPDGYWPGRHVAAPTADKPDF